MIFNFEILGASVKTDSRHVAKLLKSVFTPPADTFGRSLEILKEGNFYSIYSDGIYKATYKKVPENELLSHIEHILRSDARLVLSKRYLILHASAVEFDGKAYIILGEPGAGKSTKVLELVKMGAKYMCDDIVPIDIKRKICISLPRPIKLKFKPETKNLKMKVFEDEYFFTVLPQKMTCPPFSERHIGKFIFLGIKTPRKTLQNPTNRLLLFFNCVLSGEQIRRVGLRNIVKLLEDAC